MLYRIQKDCYLYQEFLKQQVNNADFLQTLKNFCKVHKCSVLELNIKIITSKSSAKLSVSFKDGRKTPSYDWSNVVVEDLEKTPREFHRCNINNFLTQETADQLRKPLVYSYFWFGQNLYLEVADVNTPIGFNILGVDPVDDATDKLITNLRTLCEDFDL